MSQNTQDTVANIVPFLRYDDAPAAVDWLATAFGFEKQMVVPGPDGSIAHAQLRLGIGVVMLGSSGGENPLGMKSPRELPGVSQGIYVHVEDADAHYERAKAAGADIVMDLVEQPYGSREYSARDPEGYLWSFGTYLPGAESEDA